MNVQTFITCVASTCAIIFGYIAFLKGTKKESRDSGQEGGELKRDMQYVRDRIDDVFLEQKETNRNLNALSERVTRVEESAKSAHHRIDELIANRGK
jgi:predicted  nucleic acid-binding Zn-ribbon protein